MFKFNSLIELFDKLPTEEDAHRYVASVRWKHGIVCPHCGSNRKIHSFSDGKRHKCADCRKQFTVRIGTIFQDSPITLRKWVAAVWLITSNRKGIPSTQLGREIGVPQNTAWFMLQRIRKVMGATVDEKQLSGVVEADETYIGGKEKNKHAHKRQKGTQGRSTKTKEPVIGLLQRGGDVVARHVHNTNQHTVIGEVVRTVKLGAVIATDEYRSYKPLKAAYHHITVNHGVGEYVDGMASTNGIESFWALLKRGYCGVYHYMSAKHLHRYVGEYCARYNLRDMNSDGMRCDSIISHIGCGKLSWKEVTA